MFKLRNLQHEMFFRFFVCCSASFISVQWFSPYRSFTSLVRFIPRYLMVFGVIVNEIDSLIFFFSFILLLVGRNATDFWALILYPAILLNSYISSSNFGVVFWVFRLWRTSLTTSLPVQMPFISFCCLIVEARTSSTILNNSGESGHPCYVPDLRGKALSFSPLRMIFAAGFLYMPFMITGYVPSILTLWSVLIKKGYCILSKAFSAPIERIIWLLSFL